MDPELAQMEISNFMREHVIPAWTAKYGDAGAEMEDGQFYIPMGLISSLIHHVYHDLEDGVEQGIISEEGIAGGTFALNMISELMSAAYDEVMPLYAPTYYEEENTDE